MLKLFEDLADLTRRAGAQIEFLGRANENDPNELWVDGSPVDAIRARWAARAGAERSMTLIDPADRWAGDVLRTLGEATGQPVERLQLRDRRTLRTLATIERAVVARPDEPALAVLHPAAIEATDGSELATALMERSDMTVVVVDAMAPTGVERMLEGIDAAIAGPAWRCPALLFVLPPGAIGLANRIAGFDWPAHVMVDAVTEPLGSSSALWNLVLGVWDGLHAATTARNVPTATDMLLDPVLVERQLSHVLHTDGVLACALVDTRSGALLAGEQYAAELALGVAAAACAHVMRAQIDAARMARLPASVDELVVTAGTQQHVMRNLTHRPGVFLLALLDRGRANLPLTRFKMIEADKNLT